MGKLKKPCKNAYYFFIMDEKERREKEGYRVSGGFNNLSQAFGFRWGQMSKEERAPYEQMAKDAKESEKFNINNKFTVTGESYAQVHQKKAEQQSAQQEMEDFIHGLTSGPAAGDTAIIFMKAVYSVEEILDRKTKLYWPNELSLAAFTLKGGIQSLYTQLVDTETTPTGYASQAKENGEETGLPMPGTKAVYGDECRDYLQIFKNINGFANHWLKDGYNFPGHKKVFFALDHERDHIVSCLQWLVNSLRGPERRKYQRVVDNLKVYPISKLVISLAVVANAVNPSYDNYLNQYRLDSSADAVVTKGNYDYREEIACGYHRSEVASLKMHNCAQSVVMRRIYMLFEEFIKPFGYEWRDRHSIAKLGKGIKGPVIKKKREKSPTREDRKIVEPSWLSNDVDDPFDDVETIDYSLASTATATSPSYSAWGSRPAAPASFEDDDFPTLRTNVESQSSSSKDWSRAFSSSSASRSPSSVFSASPRRGGDGGRGSGGHAASRSFMDDDDDEFPALGSGRGRGQRY